MDLIADRGRRVTVEELNTSRLLAHARKQAVQRKFDDMLIVDVDAHHYENEHFAEILPFMENEVLKQLAQSGRASTRARPNLTPQTFAQGMHSYKIAATGGPVGSWSFPPGQFTAPVDGRVVWWDPNATSNYNGQAGAYETNGKRYPLGQVPAGPPDVMPFLENVVRGRRVPASRLHEVAEHYAIFGGVSPITGLTRRQADGLAARLREVEGISSKMLAKELRDLEINLLVTRTVLDTRPVSVSYSITEYGLSVLPVNEVLVQWGLNHRQMRRCPIRRIRVHHAQRVHVRDLNDHHRERCAFAHRCLSEK